MNLDEFLRTVVTTDEGYFCLATKDASWTEYFYSWPNDIDAIVEHANAASANSNVYFSAHLFGEKRSLKELVLPSRTIQADLDHAEVATIPVMPTVLVKTSPGRHQGYWVTDREQPLDKLESLGRRIAYGIPDCDRSGWPLGHKVRLPYTYNHKYGKPIAIEVTGLALRELAADSFNLFPDLSVDILEANKDIEWIDGEVDPIHVPALELLQALKGRVSSRVASQYTKPAKDRSAALWALLTECFRANCTREQVFHLAFNSANNKFADRKYNGLRDLKKDILRAEKLVASRELDIKALVMDLRQTKGELAATRRDKISKVVINKMREQGEFVHCKGGSLWFLRRDTGRPISLTTHSEWLNTYLSSTVGLNPTEIEQKYVIQEIVGYVRGMPVSPDLQLLSYFDTYRNVLMLHTGGRDVLHISKDKVEVHPNGYGSVVFQWSNSMDVFSLDTPVSEPWWEYMFKDSLHNTVGLTREEAIAVLRTWFLFLLFRNLATTRPILALFGQPGSGKTTAAKLFYRLIYGRYKNVSGLGDSDDFDMAVSSQPFVALDNLDTWTPWLPDKLALCAADSDIEKRKLYTDSDTILLRRQALVAITAHNPRFAREDITDRLILLMFHRLGAFKSETEILDRISKARGAIWAAILADIQHILNTPKPPAAEIPQFRIEDFARLGYWFAVSADQGDLFKQAMAKIQSRQRSFNLEEDQTLVVAIQNYLKKRKPNAVPSFENPTILYNRIAACAADPDLFRRQYKNAMQLARKLWVMHDSLKTMFDCQWKDEGGTRTWLLGAKDGGA